MFDPDIAAVPGRWRRRVRSLAMLAGLACALSAYPGRGGAQDRLQPGTIQARVAACTGCHGAQGRPGPDGYYPRLAGKPQAYLFEQLKGFRDGRRAYEPMRYLLAGLPDDYLNEMAGYFASLHLPYPASSPAPASASLMEHGRRLAQTGDASRGLPACAACHGQALGGIEPAIPGLLGLRHDYIVSQIGGWRSGLRRASEPDCMAEIARRLAPEDISAVAAWLASRPVPASYRAEPAGGAPLPLACGTQDHGAEGRP